MLDVCTLRFGRCINLCGSLLSSSFHRAVRTRTRTLSRVVSRRSGKSSTGELDGAVEDEYDEYNELQIEELCHLHPGKGGPTVSGGGGGTDREKWNAYGVSKRK